MHDPPRGSGPHGWVDPADKAHGETPQPATPAGSRAGQWQDATPGTLAWYQPVRPFSPDLTLVVRAQWARRPQAGAAGAISFPFERILENLAPRTQSGSSSLGGSGKKKLPTKPTAYTKDPTIAAV